MVTILSPEQMRSCEQKLMDSGTPSVELMRRAAEGIYAAHQWNGPVAIVCGSGNNGGDGYALALLLKKAMIDCTVFYLSEAKTEDARFYRDLCIQQTIPVLPCTQNTGFTAYATVVDCIFGTGFHGTVQEPASSAIRSINASGAFVVSADINSGLDSHNGMSDLCVISGLTVAIGAYKPGHFLSKASDIIGKLTVCDIGIETITNIGCLWESADVSHSFPPRPHMCNKSDFGYIGLVGGCDRYSGAIRLASMANSAMRAGAGVVKIAAPASLSTVLASCVLESTLFPLADDEHGFKFVRSQWEEFIRGLKVIAFGMGFGKNTETHKALLFLLENYHGILILDADGLNLLSETDYDLALNHPCSLVLTPHLKECSRLSGFSIDDILKGPVAVANDLAKHYHATVLLKGPCTIVTDGEETVFVHRGCPGMATAGSGDVLSGIAAAVCACKTGSVVSRMASAAWVNGCAGELAEKKYGTVSMIAGDTVSMIPEVILSLRDQLP